MSNENVKDQLITAAMRLLSQSKDPGKVTARQIARESGANLAMINYYFPSKDALISDAVGRLLAGRANELKNIRDSHLPPRQKLLDFFIAMADITIDYSEITRPTVPYLLLEAELDLPYLILPMIKNCRGGKMTETQCRIMAYQLISFSQLVFYRSTDFFKLTGIDMSDKSQRDAMFESVLGFFFDERGAK